MWMIGDPHVRVEMVTIHDMLTFVLNILTSKVNAILASFSGKECVQCLQEFLEA